MHSWDVMPANNYDHNWYGGTHIKNESPQEMITTYSNLHQPPNMDASPGTSPQSMDPDGGMFYDQNNPNHRPIGGFNPLTPPGYPGAVLPITKHNQQNLINTTPCRSGGVGIGAGGQFIAKHEQTNFQNQTTLTPSHTPPMDVTPPKSPKIQDETPKKEIEQMSDNYMDSGDETRSLESDYDEEGAKLPNNKNANKAKKYKCKQCDHVSLTKMSFWQHTKSHIKPEKMLKCPKCPFVTEYKHHLEYHLRNHDGSKPFQCPNCHYSCVNKSMLNSHLKSHSNIYQYRCTDCNYATKYCHSLKLHLRKYSHKPAMVLNQDGTPNPLPIIDVYGTRRGPKTRPSKLQQQQQQQQHHQQHNTQSTLHQGPSMCHNIKEEPTQSTTTPSRKSINLNKNLDKNTDNNQQQQQLPNLISSMLPNSLANMLHPGTSVPMFPYLNLNFHMLAVRQQQVLSQLSPNNVQDTSLHSSQDEDNDENNEEDNDDEMYHHHNNNLEQQSFNNNNLNNNNNINRKDKINSSVLDLSSQQLINNNHHQHQQYEQSSEKLTNLDNNIYNSSHNNHHENDEHYGGEEEIEDDEEEEDDEAKLPTSTSNVNGDPTTPSIKNRRKGQAFKLKLMKDCSDENDDDNHHQHQHQHHHHHQSQHKNIIISKEDSNITNSPETPSQSQTAAATTTTSSSSSTSSSSAIQSSRQESKSYDCKFCDISFKDAVLYTIHMGYHGYNDVFKCNMCGEKCDDRIAFFLHIARNPHS